MQEYIIENNGRKRKAIRKLCETCGSSFLIRIAWSITGRYCSPLCKAKGSQERVGLECALCGKKFERSKSRLLTSRHRTYFCSRACKDKGQSMDGGVKIIRPPHYGTGISDYRLIADKFLERKCSCGFFFSGLLGVHHKDGNRKNSDVSNLEVVCPMCHTIRHMKETKSGWVMTWAALTPREMIPVVEAMVFATRNNK